MSGRGEEDDALVRQVDCRQSSSRLPPAPAWEVVPICRLQVRIHVRKDGVAVGRQRLRSQTSRRTESGGQVQLEQHVRQHCTTRAHTHTRQDRNQKAGSTCEALSFA